MDNTASAYLLNLENLQSFTRQALFKSINKSGRNISESSFKVLLSKLLDEGIIARSGRNAYYIPSDSKKQYFYSYSEYANEIAQTIRNASKDLDFTVIETYSLNEFLNHLIGKNTVFLYVEKDCESFVFELLNQKYPGKVLIKPTLEIFNQYWQENSIIIQKLVSEAPKKSNNSWESKIEKILVDLFTDKLLQSCFESSELKSIFEQTFERYFIDESTLFRYARRRKTEDSLLAFIRERTDVKLKTR